MKKIILILSFCLIAFLVSAQPQPDWGAQGDSLIKILPSGNAYAAGGMLIVSDDVPGDLIIAGGQLTVNGNVGEDLMIAGGTLTVNGDVAGDVRAAGGQIILNGNVGGELVAAGGQVLVSKDSTISGDAMIAAGEASIDGVINGNADVGVGTFLMGDSAMILGDLDLEADTVGEGIDAKVSGELKKVTTEFREHTIRESWTMPKELKSVFNVFIFLKGILASILLGGLLIYLYPSFTSKATKLVKTEYIKSLVAGVVMLAVTPILIVLFMLMVIGVKVSLIITLATIIGLLLATIPVKIVVGELLFKRIWKRKSKEFYYYCVGVAAFAICYEIPLIGWLIKIVAALVGFGAIWVLTIRGSGLGKTIKI
ncbi:MAG: hypothetical protein ABH851_09165 [Methanobacteriota archaeon]